MKVFDVRITYKPTREETLRNTEPVRNYVTNRVTQELHRVTQSYTGKNMVEGSGRVMDRSYVPRCALITLLLLNVFYKIRQTLYGLTKLSDLEEVKPNMVNRTQTIERGSKKGHKTFLTKNLPLLR